MLDSIIIPALSALIAGWIGVRMGLREHREKYLFDAQVEWFQDMSIELFEHAGRLRELGTGVNPRVVYERGSSDRLAEKLRHAGFWASAESVRTLNNWIRMMARSGEVVGGAQADALAEYSMKAGLAIQNELRAKLGLPALADPESRIAVKTVHLDPETD